MLAKITNYSVVQLDVTIVYIDLHIWKMTVTQGHWCRSSIRILAEEMLRNILYENPQITMMTQ